MKIRIIPSAILSSSLALLLTFSALAAEPSVQQLQTDAQKGDATAQFELARVYLKGAPGLDKDEKKALELLQAAAAQGHAEAMGAVGFIYASGAGVPRNEDEAIRWFRMGAEKGGPKSQLNLGNMLVHGKGTEKNLEEGVAWIQKAADQGLPDAAIAYGNILYFGEYGRAVDYGKAFPYLLKGAESGNAECQNMVGVMFENGKGTLASEATAEKWLRQGAEQGNVKAQSNLGHLLGPESEDASRRVEALTWLMVASDQNEVMAKQTLGDLVKVANPDEFAKARKAASEYREAHPPKMERPFLPQ